MNRKNKRILSQFFEGGTSSPAVKLKRLKLVLLIFAVVMVMLGYFRVLWIKVNHSDFEANAINQQIVRQPNKIISPNRGDIIDRNGEYLAVGETVFDIIVDPKLFAEIDLREVEEDEDNKKSAAQNGKEYTPKEFSKTKGLNFLSSKIDISNETMKPYVTYTVEADENDPQKKVAKAQVDKYYVRIAENVPYDIGKELNDMNLRWLYAEQTVKRNYPYGSLAAQVLGFTRTDSSWGLEQTYNSYMLGVPGRTFRVHEENGNFVTKSEAPIKGDTIVTTLDAHLQKYADDACKKAYEAYQPEYAASIIMNPQTAEIYAMAQYPTFDPNQPLRITNLDGTNDVVVPDEVDTEKREEADKIVNHAWKNYCISETFEPGSIYKPIVVAMALEEGIISPSNTFVCGGYKKVAEEEIKCHNTAGHGTLDVAGVLAQSCNVGMMDIISKMSPEVYSKYQHDFGFGEKTGIDLPGEVSASGLLHSVEQLRSVEMATNSFGQGFNCTAIQAANAMAAVINGGKLMKPYVVSQILDNDGNIIEEKGPQVVRQVISQSTSDWVRTALEKTYTEGTAKKAQIVGYSFGGKTGTAQQSPRAQQKYVLSFVAYHDVANPDIMVMTVLHKPKNYSDVGGDASPVPMLKEIFEDIIDYEALAPDNDGKSSEESSYTVKDYTNSNLKSTVNELISEGIDFQILGSGDSIKSQSPAPGTKLDAKPTKILLNAEIKNKTKLVPVPNVVGLSVENAKVMLESAGFNVDVSVEKNDGFDFGIEEIATESATIRTIENKDDEKTTQKTDKDSEETTERAKSNDDENDSNGDNADVGESVYVQMPGANVKVESGMTIKIRVR